MAGGTGLGYDLVVARVSDWPVGQTTHHVASHLARLLAKVLCRANGRNPICDLLLGKRLTCVISSPHGTGSPSASISPRQPGDACQGARDLDDGVLRTYSLLMDAPMWKLRHARVTVFWESPTSRANWADFNVGGPVHRQESLETATSELRGPLGPAVLVLSNSPGRSDWILASPSPGPSNEPIGDYPSCIEEFIAKATAWLSNQSDAVIRLAHGVVLDFPVEDREAGYLMLNRLLSMEVDPHKMSDLFYQVNRPCNSKVVEGLRVNRVMKWVVQANMRMSFVGPKVHRQSQSFAVSVELDLSTPADREDPISELSAQLVEELVNHGKLIAKKGELA